MRRLLPSRVQLNVCMIGYTMYDSDGRVIRYAETLAKRGDRVDFIALKGEGDPDEEVRNGVRLFRIQQPDIQGEVEVLLSVRDSGLLFPDHVVLRAAETESTLRPGACKLGPGFSGLQRMAPQNAGREGDS